MKKVKLRLDGKEVHFNTFCDTGVGDGLFNHILSRSFTFLSTSNVCFVIFPGLPFTLSLPTLISFNFPLNARTIRRIYELILQKV